jgi:hypothetical protein
LEQLLQQARFLETTEFCPQWVGLRLALELAVLAVLAALLVDCLLAVEALVALPLAVVAHLAVVAVVVLLLVALAVKAVFSLNGCCNDL